MKVLFWNARGIGNPNTRMVLAKYCFDHKPDLVLLSEPKIGLDQFPTNYWKRLNLKVFTVNERHPLIPNIWGMRSSNMSPSILECSQQHISFSLVINSRVFVSAVYASTSHIDRRSLWLELASLQQSHRGPWCFIEDFIAVFGAHEKIGGRLPSTISCEEFRAWSDTGSLTHITTRGAAYTWSNLRKSHDHIELRLDRAVCNDDWLNVWFNVACCTFPTNQSNHYPILLIMKKDFVSHPSPFKFHNMWTDHIDC